MHANIYYIDIPEKDKRESSKTRLRNTTRTDDRKQQQKRNAEKTKGKRITEEKLQKQIKKYPTQNKTDEVGMEMTTAVEIAILDTQSQKGLGTCASGYRAWRWVWVPRGGGVERPREPSRASRVVRASQCGGGREGGWERQRFPGS